MRNLLSVRLNVSFFAADAVLHFQSAVIAMYENTDKICKILLLPVSYGPRESGSSLRVSFFVPDRKQLQIARGIAAHGARQTEVSENKPRAVASAQQSRRNNKCNSGEVITEGNRHSDKNTSNSTTVNSTVLMVKMPFENVMRAFQIANRVICHDKYLQNARWTCMEIDD